MGVLHLDNVTFKPNLQLWSRHHSFTHKVESCTWNCQSDSLHWEIPRVQESPDRPEWESCREESIKKRSIPNEKKKWIWPERIPRREWRERTAAVSLLEEVKNIVQTFSFQCSLYPHESWLHALWSTQQIPSHFPIDFPHSVCPPISPAGEERIKAHHAARGFKLGVWQERKEWLSETKRRNHGGHLNNSAASDGWGSGEHPCENIANDSQ